MTVVVQDGFAAIDAVLPAPNALPRLSLGAVEDLSHGGGDRVHSVLVDEREQATLSDAR